MSDDYSRGTEWEHYIDMNDIQTSLPLMFEKDAKNFAEKNKAKLKIYKLSDF